MNTELTRQYKLPKQLSNKTTTLIKLAHQQSLAIPNAKELQTIKADLEVLLPLSESRTQDLKKGLHNLDGNIKIYDSGDDTMDKTRIKQEPNDFSEILFIPKNGQQSRQAALETIKRKRRKDETEEGIRRSESPHVKLKHMESMQRAYESMSPPSDIKRKKQMSNHARALDEPDFIRVKAKDQVPITNFWAAVDPYFRPLTEEDRSFLMERADTSKAYLIPSLGEHYLDQWSREDQLIYNKSPFNSRHSSVDPQQQIKLKYVNDPITEEQLLHDDLTSGSLTERLLSSLVTEDNTDHLVINQEEEEEEEEKGEGSTLEITDFEERLKRELRYVGLFTEDDDWNAREDDEICAELRALGREYKEQVEVNDYRKKRLLEVVGLQLSFEQYKQVLDTLDSQIEQGYIKRFRNQKSKKRKAISGQKSTLSENAVSVMDRRKQMIDALGEIFKDMNQNMPSKSIYSSETTTTIMDENNNNN